MAHTRKQQSQLLTALIYRLSSSEAEQILRATKEKEYAGQHLGTSSQAAARRDIEALATAIINEKSDYDINIISESIDNALAL